MSASTAGDAAFLACVREIADGVSAPNADAVDREARFPQETIDALRGMGHELVLRNENLSTSFFARPNGVSIDAAGVLRGGVFPFTPATAIGL